MEVLRLLSNEEIRDEIENLKNWEVIEMHYLKGIFRFKNYVNALDFVIEVGNIAEDLEHHPEINLSYGKVVITIFTHDLGGLTELDFLFADKVNQIKLNK